MSLLKPLKSKPSCRKQNGETFMREAKVASLPTSNMKDIGWELKVIERNVEERMEDVEGHARKGIGEDEGHVGGEHLLQSKEELHKSTPKAVVVHTNETTIFKIKELAILDMGDLVKRDLRGERWRQGKY